MHDYYFWSLCTRKLTTLKDRCWSSNNVHSVWVVDCLLLTDICCSLPHSDLSFTLTLQLTISPSYCLTIGRWQWKAKDVLKKATPAKLKSNKRVGWVSFVVILLLLLVVVVIMCTSSSSSSSSSPSWSSSPSPSWSSSSSSSSLSVTFS